MSKIDQSLALMDLTLPHSRFQNKEHLENSFVYSGRFHEKYDQDCLLLFDFLAQFHLGISSLTRVNYELGLKVCKGMCVCL